MNDPFDDLIKLWDATSDERIAWQKTRKTRSIDDLFDTLKQILSKEREIKTYEEAIKSLSSSTKTAALAAKYKNLYEIHSFLSDVLVELLTRVSSEIKKRPASGFIDPRIKSMIAEQVRIEVSKELWKLKVKHDSKGAKNHFLFTSEDNRKPKNH